MKNLVRKILKIILLSFIGLFITVNLMILLSGRFYLYKGIANTYLVGKMSPTIYDLDVFPYSTIQKGAKTAKLNDSDQKNVYNLSKAEWQLLKKAKTKAFIVLKNNELLYEQYWDGHTDQTVSNSFSVAKTVVSLLVGVAVGEGKIESIDDPVAKYLEEFKEGDKAKITIRHLLTMSSGLDWTESGKNPLSNNAESYYGTYLYDLVTKQRVMNEPGKMFKYQSGNSQLLGFILEKATGEDLSAYAEKKIWKKLGAQHDAYWSLDKEQGDEKAFCCMYATARDYARLKLLILNKGEINGEQIIPKSYFEKMVVPAELTTEEGIPNYRYGLHIWTYNDGTRQINYCRGIKGQYVITIPDEDLVIIRLGSSKKINFKLDEDRLDEPGYYDSNKYKVGHSASLFDVIQLGIKIKNHQKK